MKKIFLLTLFSFYFLTQAQVIIGPASNTTFSSKAILAFTTTNRGIVLPYVDDTSAVSNVIGTLLVDRSNQMISMRTADGWNNLIGDQTATNIPAKVSGSKEVNNSGVVIGTRTTSTPDGVLVLEDANKALILPQISNPDQNLIAPAVGTIVYGIPANSTRGGLLYVFDGSKWNILSAGAPASFKDDGTVKPSWAP